ncbi:hypothetical protein AB0C59_26535 [Streptomyces sp. NPDC048664]|uniref:hypothetical protein n=1 Tax=Streptomyces sp. NPDC048664 TaxID=3154505 RepID=UPI00342CC343
MGRRTGARWRAPGSARTPGRTALVLCVTAALTALTALTAAAGGVPARPAPAAPPPYAFDRDARTVQGSPGTTGAARLDAGHSYRSSLPAEGRRYYRLELDSAVNAYASVTAVPGAGARVTSSDGIKVSVQDADGITCSTGVAYVGPTQSPHPLVASAARQTGPGTYGCADAGTYYVVVERRATAASPSASGDWDLELGYVSEPAPRQAGATSPPGAWDSASPAPVQGEARERPGGAGFAAASALGQGVWRDAIEPGQTLFYKVPVDWGQRISATAELGSSTGAGGAGYVGTALAVSLYNPVRAHVEDAGAGYGGAQASAVLGPLPPVAYANRHSVSDRVGAMRFGGWYYLAVHLGTPVADRFGDGPFGLTLRVRVSGTPASPPSYAGRPVPGGVFEVTAADREAAAPRPGERIGAGEGTSAVPSTDTRRRGDGATAAGRGEAAGGSGRAMELVAAGGLGTGAVLVLWLGLWTALARRRARGGWAARPSRGRAG